VIRPELTRRRVWAARLIAIAVDAAEIVLMPVFGPGFASPANAVLDVATAVALTILLGWHWALLPTLVAEMLPGVSLVPTWTAAVLLATRGRA
jgi:hypothetical protein